MRRANAPPSWLHASVSASTASSTCSATRPGLTRTTPQGSRSSAPAPDATWCSARQARSAGITTRTARSPPRDHERQHQQSGRMEDRRRVAHAKRRRFEQRPRWRLRNGLTPRPIAAGRVCGRWRASTSRSAKTVHHSTMSCPRPTRTATRQRSLSARQYVSFSRRDGESRRRDGRRRAGGARRQTDRRRHAAFDVPGGRGVMRPPAPLLPGQPQKMPVGSASISARSASTPALGAMLS